MRGFALRPRLLRRAPVLGGASLVYAWDRAVHGATLPAGFTFSRTSTALRLLSGVYSSVAQDVPRIEDYGLLIEGARTNIITQSAEPLVGVGTSKTSNNVVAPNGVTEADTITETAVTNDHDCRPTAAVTSGLPYVLSIHWRQLSGSRGWFHAFTGAFAGNFSFAFFNASTYATTLSGSGAAGTTAGDLGLIGSWRRLWAKNTPASTGTGEFRFGAHINNVGNYAGDIGVSWSPWGIQVEQADFVSSPIPTAGSAATRAAETCIATLAGSPALVSHRHVIRTAAGLSGDQVAWQIDDNTAGNRVRSYRNSSGDWIIERHAGGSLSGTGILRARINGASVVNHTGGQINLGAVANLTSATIELDVEPPSGLTRERWGHGVTGNELFGHLAEMARYSAARLS